METRAYFLLLVRLVLGLVAGSAATGFLFFLLSGLLFFHLDLSLPRLPWNRYGRFRSRRCSFYHGFDFLRRRAERHVRYALRRAALWAREFDVFSVLILLAGRRWLHPDALVVEPSIAFIAANHRSQRVVRASTHTVQLTPLTQLLELLLEI